jgi:hypothetical protein
MKNKQLTSLLMGVLILGMVSCEYQTIVPVPLPVDFTKDIEPVFLKRKCTVCHTSAQQPNLTKDYAFNSLMSMNLLDTANPANSKLYVKITSGHNSSSVAESEKALILRWISEGAKGVVPPVSFKNDVAPIFVKAGCAGCHAGSNPPDFRTDQSYASLTSGGFVDNTVPAASKLVVKINSGHATSGNITANDKDALLKWIEQGAKNN